MLYGSSDAPLECTDAPKAPRRTPCMARYRRSSRERDDTDELPKVRITGRTLREAARLGRYLLPYKFTFALAMAALTVSSLLGLTFPAVAGRLVNGALAPA